MCLLTMMLTVPSLSQMRRPQRRFGPPRSQRPQRPSRAERAKRIEQAKKQAKEQARIQATREALEATNAQWRIIQPRLTKVKELQKQANIAVTIKNAAWVTTTTTTQKGGASPVTETDRQYENWGYKRPWESNAGLVGAEKACEALVVLLESNTATDQQKKEAMAMLRRAKEEAGKQLVQARQELREVLTFRQEAILLMMGWLN